MESKALLTTVSIVYEVMSISSLGETSITFILLASEVKEALEVINFHEERIRAVYGSVYSDYILADGKTQRKFKNECSKRCDDLIAQLRIIEVIKSDIKSLDKQTK